MPVAVRVEAAVLGKRQAGTAEHPVELSLAEGIVPLSDLIAAVVRSEVAAFNQRVELSSLVRVLTEASLADGVAAGAVRSGERPAGAIADPEPSVAAALLAHRDGLYQVVIDDEPVDDLDQTIAVNSRTRLLFLRLVPLAGG